MAQGACILCSTYEIFDHNLQRCVPNCGNNAFFIPSSRICECERGFYRIQGKCGICGIGQVYDPVLQCCTGK